MFKRPPKTNLGKFYDTLITFLWHSLKEHRELLEAKEELLTVTESRYVCGFPVPRFQRELVWTQEQQIRFIESIWKGIPIGSFIIHRLDWEAGGKPVPFAGWVIDGQQRLTAIEAYWNGGFSVFGAYWGDLERQDQIEFLHTKFSHYEASLKTEEEILDMYLLMAFGGTAHTDKDRFLANGKTCNDN